MRFVVVPNFVLPYDRRMVRGLALGLESAGHEALALSTPVEDSALPRVCSTYDADVVIRVNRFRPLRHPLPSKVRHVAWFQDVFPETLADVHDRIQDKDIVYVLGDPQTLGFNVQLPCHVSTLLCGIDETIQQTEAAASEIDFSLCGFIPPPLRHARSIKRDLVWLALPLIEFLNRFGPLVTAVLARTRNVVPYAISTGLVSVVETTYQPLCGNLDIHQLTAAMNEFLAVDIGYKLPSRRVKVRKPRSMRRLSATILAPYQDDSDEGGGRWGAIRRFTSFLARDYPRLLDRVFLIDRILTVSNSLELYGPGWTEHPEYRPYHKGILDSPAELANIFCRSRLNLANNTHGLGLHSRTLECMAVGGFIFTHASPSDGKPGGMHSAFEPGVHYGVFTPSTIAEEARRWLRDEARRKKAGADASVIVRQNHTWRHRAQQILADLAR